MVYMGNLKKGISPMLYIILLCLLFVGIYFTFKSEDDDISSTLGTIVSDNEITENIKEIDLENLDRELFFNAENSNYVGDEICQQFPKNYVEGVVDKKISLTQEINNGNNVGCVYHFDSVNYSLSILLKNGSFSNEKRGHELIGRTVLEYEDTDLEGYVVENGKKQIIEVYIILTELRFLRIGINSTEESYSEILINLTKDISRELSIYRIE